MARDVSFVFDPFEIAGVDKETIVPSEVARILSEVSDLVVSQVLKDTKNQISPVDGSDFEALSKDYAKFKKKSGKKPIPNLRFDGDLMDALAISVEPDDKLKLYVEASQSDKADGHNNHSGDSKLPLRRYVPLEGVDSGFRDVIENKIKRIVNSADLIEQPSLADQAIAELVAQGVTATLTGR